MDWQQTFRWAADNLIPQWITAIFAFAALWVALLARRTNVSVMRNSYRPVVRPVKVIDKQRGALNPRKLILKNIGRGPAISIFLIENDDHQTRIVAERDVLEPLGGPLKGGGEESRIGRIVIPLPPPLEPLRVSVPYLLAYQDLESRWHGTVFTLESDGRIKSRQLGALNGWTKRLIPKEVLKEAQMMPVEWRRP